MCHSTKKYSDIVIGCNDIRVNVVLAPDSDYVWEITDVFGNQYLLAFTTDADGYGTIDISQLPDGFCNPGMQSFTLRLKQTIESCDYIPLAFIQKFDRALVEIKAGNIDKSFIGCPYVVPSGGSFTSARIQFDGAEDQTSYQNDALKNSKQLIVVNESGVMVDGDGVNQYTFDAVTGEITFGQTVEGQNITLIYFK